MPELVPVSVMLRSSVAVLRRCAPPLALVVTTAWLPFSIVFCAWVLGSFDISRLQASPEAIVEAAASLTPTFMFWAGLALLPLTYVCAVSLVSAAGAIAAHDFHQGREVTFRVLLGRSLARTPRSVLAYVAIVGSSALVCTLVFAFTLLSALALSRLAHLSGTWLIAAIACAAAIMAVAGVVAWLWVYSKLALAPVAAAVAPRKSFVLSASIAASRHHSAGILGRAILVGVITAAILSVPAGLALLGQLAGVWLALAALALRAGVSMTGALLQTVAMTPVYQSARQDATAPGE